MNDPLILDYTSSTELLVYGSESWTFTGSLPSRLYDLRAANIDNRVLVAGIQYDKDCHQRQYWYFQEDMMKTLTLNLMQSWNFHLITWTGLFWTQWRLQELNMPSQLFPWKTLRICVPWLSCKVQETNYNLYQLEFQWIKNFCSAILFSNGQYFSLIL